jgi:prolyl-tRNA synthetase
MVKTPTPGKAKCEDVAALLNIPLAYTVKSIVLAAEKLDAEGQPSCVDVWLLLIRGDHELNEIKAGKVEGLKGGFRFATEAEIIEHFDCPPGYLGPVGLKKPVKIVADRTVANMSDFVSGANEIDFHFTGMNWGRDLPEPEVVADLRNVVPGDPSPDGKGVLAIQRGIEVGHVFSGLPYPEKMKLMFTDETGKSQQMIMGCYGIGVTRLMGAAIEQNHDDKGIIWPDAIAPFTVALAPMGYDRSELVKKTADTLYEQLIASGVDVFFDDRGERPGAMLADLELIGIPHRVVIGERGLKEGNVEYQHRRDEKATPVRLADIIVFLKERLTA